jgi:hypothetical protein
MYFLFALVQASTADASHLKLAAKFDRDCALYTPLLLSCKLNVTNSCSVTMSETAN